MSEQKQQTGDGQDNYGQAAKQTANAWLAHLISAPLSQAHIGYLGEYYCELVMRESSKLLQAKQAIKRYKENRA